MRITILTVFPEMFHGFISSSIIKRAIEKQLVEIQVVDFRSYAANKSNRVDDYPYGGGAGMVLQCQPIIDALKDVKKENSYVLCTNPIGTVFDQKVAHRLAQHEDLVILCGHYEGYDARIYDYVDEQMSIGDYVLTGGELAAMVISDAVIRLVDGVIKKDSYCDESFENGLLEYPQYTRPAEYDGKKVPEVLLSGHHKNIQRWRLKKSLEITQAKRPDLLEKRLFTKEELEILEEIDQD